MDVLCMLPACLSRSASLHVLCDTNTELVTALAVKFPSLKELSLIRNPACPGFASFTRSEERENARCVTLSGLRWFALVCVGLRWFALVALVLRCYALVCIALRCFALLCVALRCFALSCGARPDWVASRWRCGVAVVVGSSDLAKGSLVCVLTHTCAHHACRYRLYAVAHLPNLVMLDCSPVSKKERAAAVRAENARRRGVVEQRLTEEHATRVAAASVPARGSKVRTVCWCLCRCACVPLCVPVRV